MNALINHYRCGFWGGISKSLLLRNWKHKQDVDSQHLVRMLRVLRDVSVCVIIYTNLK